MTPLWAKPWSVRRTSGMDEATDYIVGLVDEAVAAAQELVDKALKALLENRPSLTPTEEQILAARGVGDLAGPSPAAQCLCMGSVGARFLREPE